MKNNESQSIPQINLALNYSISRILKGGWQLAGGHGVITAQQAVDDMFQFVAAGITTFDCADIYTGVEEFIGLFRNAYAKRFGKFELEKIRVHTKFVPDLDILPHISKLHVEKIIDRSLQRLNADCIDLVQFHWWDYDVHRYIETAHYLKDLQSAGKILHLGVTNFDVPRLREIINSGIPIISNQVQYSLLDHRPENGMAQFCLEQDIKLLCYGTVAGGFLSKKYLNLPEAQEPFVNRSLTKYKLIIDDFGGWALFQELLSTLEHIAAKHNVSITNVATKYVLDKQAVAGVIIGARDISHLKDNLCAFNLNLDKSDYIAIQKILEKASGPEGDIYALERKKGGKHAGIMKYNLNKHE